MVRRRTLKPEEKELWQVVARTAKPMHPPVFRPKVVEQSEAPTFLDPPRTKPRVEAFRIGTKAVSHKPPLKAATAIQMDAKAFGKMTRGKLLPEARIDLHGMTLAEAHPELTRFILGASAEGLRLVLVITGKGKQKPDHGPIPQRMGVLRHQLPHWLRQPPIAPLILQFTESHLRHGGAGAFYVYLRRSR